MIQKVCVDYSYIKICYIKSSTIKLPYHFDSLLVNRTKYIISFDFLVFFAKSSNKIKALSTHLQITLCYFIII